MKRSSRQSYTLLPVVAAVLMFNATAHATVINFATDPFLGSTAPTTPGRQIVGNELFTDFNIATDVFSLDPIVFGVSSVQFINDIAGNLPASGVNVIVLQTFDNDADPTTPFGAGNAANLIAAQLTTPTPGFFIYFNSGLDLPRLVFSPDLSDNQSDLKILARLQNLTGQAGRDAMPTFTASNFAVPEGGNNLILFISAGALMAAQYAFRRRTVEV